MLQLAWAINTYLAFDGAPPIINFSGPAKNHWYNTDQAVTWTVADAAGGSAAPIGVAGYSQAWDSDPGDPTSEPTPGSGNSFYSGPQFPNGTSGLLDFTLSGVSQGCHSVNVRAWDNSGLSSDQTYGPLCYDTIPPNTLATLPRPSVEVFDTPVYSIPVVVNLTATDPGQEVCATCSADTASTGSGVASTVYRIDKGKVQTYTGPFTATSDGIHTVAFHSTDVAGNVEATKSVSFVKLEARGSTSVISSENPTLVGQPVGFTAMVASTDSVTPTGTVTFRDGASVLGKLALSGGQATFVIKNLSVGQHLITASYSGDINFFPNISPALTQTVEVGAY